MTGMTAVRPAFVLSLPRSGSTLVQRVLASHPDVSSRAEPWLLLPALYALRPDGVFAEYDHATARHGLTEFLDGLPGGPAGYARALRGMATELYTEAAEPGARVFVDKTPRYALVAHELATAFPDAPIVVLWRNPLAVAASMVETWNAGRWSVHKYKVDLVTGLARLVDLVRDRPDRVHAVRYEDLLGAEREAHWRALFEHLGVDFEPKVLEAGAAHQLAGSLGDPTSRRYADLSTEPLTKWTRTFATPVRRAWARRYLAWIGSERLALMGYASDALLEALRGAPSASAATNLADGWFTAYGVAHHVFELKQLRAKARLLRSWPDLHAHR